MLIVNSIHYSLFKFLFIAIFLVSCKNPDLKLVYLNHSDSAKYVGINQCKVCHQDKYESFIETGMGKSFDKASHIKSSAKFDKNTVVYDSKSDFYYHPFWDNDSLKILEFRLQEKDTIYKRIEKVDFIVGSGQHTNSHIFNVNGYLHQMPLTFYTQKQKWDLPPGFENGNNTRFDRKIGLECMSCHNSFPNFVLGSENKYNSVPEGVSCENCHGPGSIHVQQKMTGNLIDTSKAIDYSIVNPGKLPINLQFDICQRCHLQGNTVLKDNKSFFDFKPGMKLSDFMTTFLPRYQDSDNEFIMASHADRLKQSECFIQTSKNADNQALRPYKNALTCVTCHNPHVSVQKTGKEIFNNACKNCHNESSKKKLCSEKQEVRMKETDNCVKCHMPKSGSIDIPHVTVHDHKIKKPLQKSDIQKVKKFINLVAVNEENPSDQIKAKAYLQQFEKFEKNEVYLDSAQAFISANSLEKITQNIHLLVHLNFIKQDFSKILDFVNQIGKDKLLNSIISTQSWDNVHAWTSYRIGEAYFAKGDYPNAFQFYQKSTILAPYNLEFKNKLGVSLLAQKDHLQAITIFQELLKEYPKNAVALNNLGYAYMLDENNEKAIEFYNLALSLNPDYELLLLNLAAYYNLNKIFPKAKVFLQRVLKLNPDNEQARLILKSL